MTIATPGSIIHATHRPQDLIPAFLAKLQSLDAAAYRKVREDYPEYNSSLKDDDPFWNWDFEVVGYMLDELFDRLNDYAPESHYFGAHVGDGSDFGFWEYQEDAE